MSRLIFVVLAFFCLAPAMAAEDPAVSATQAAAPGAEINSAQMEKDLQSLNWKQFRSVVEAVPKMKADVDAYGPLGWQYVQANYKTYAWKKSVDRLDVEQKHHLADLIEAAKKTP